MKIEATSTQLKTTKRSHPDRSNHHHHHFRSKCNSPAVVVVLALAASIYLARPVVAPKPPVQSTVIEISSSNSQVATSSDTATSSNQSAISQLAQLNNQSANNINSGRGSFNNSGRLQQPQPQPQQNHAPNERINLIEADENGLYLVGLFDIHHSNPRVPFKCGPIDVDVGEWHSRRPMQNMEAFLWAIEQVNADKSLLPGVRLGSLVMDTCSSFLRTNQQLANLLHGNGNGNPHPAAGTSGQGGAGAAGKVNSNRQIAGIVADNADWQSVEAVISMANAQGLTTFVTQSRSSKLSELARKYKPTNQLDLNQNLRLSLSQSHPIGLAAVDPGDANGDAPVRGTSSLISGSGSGRYRRHSGAGPMPPPLDGLLGELLGIGKMTSPRPMAASGQDNTASAFASSSSRWLWPEEQRLHTTQQVDQQQQQQPQAASKLYMVRMLLGNELLADAIGSLVQQMNWDLVSVIYDDDPDIVDLHDELMRQLIARNIQLALDEQIPMGAPTETYDRLVQSLAKKTTMGARVVVTLLGTGSARLLLDSLHHLRSSINQHNINNSTASQQQHEELAMIIRRVNSLLWITMTDREPYYAFATDSLGTIAISSSVSLLPEFRSHYDTKLANEQHGAVNRWWPEYMRAILLKHQKDIELLSNECARWQEPRVSPLNEKCRSLTLSSLVQFEKTSSTNNQTNLLIMKANLARPQVAAAAAAASGKPFAMQAAAAPSSQPPHQASNKLAKYLAAGWEHNGMDIINSVLAVANALESIRQTLCPNQQVGLCDRMRELIMPTTSLQSAGGSNANINNRDITAAAANKPPMLSELIYNELLRSTFQLADGRMFNLDDFNSPVGQVEGKFKLYNLRYLQQNSIGFVKFGSFDQMDGLELNTSKARHYPAANSYLDQEPLETVKSTCEDESKCLMLGTLFPNEAVATQGQGGAPMMISEEELASGVNSLFKLDHPLLIQPPPSAAAAGDTGGGSEHGAASRGLQHPASQPRAQAGSTGAASVPAIVATIPGAGTGTDGSQQQPNNQHKQQQQTFGKLDNDSQFVYTMRSAPSMGSLSNHWTSIGFDETPADGSNHYRNTSASEGPTTGGQIISTAAGQQQQQQHRRPTIFNTIVLLPLHKGGYQSLSDGGCLPGSSAMDWRSFQLLAALAYVQQSVNCALVSAGQQQQQQLKQQSDIKLDKLDRQVVDSGGNNNDVSSQLKPQIELTTTVIDYCDQLELAKAKLQTKLDPVTESNPHGQQEIFKRLPVNGKTVAVIDFDAQVSENIDNLIVGAGNGKLLHLTIGSGLPSASLAGSNNLPSYERQQPQVNSDDSKAKSALSQHKTRKPSSNHLKLSLMPSKSNEIQALVKLISSMAHWRLVHLIYTDHHHYRDEFVRRANEANICVSKLIWIPSAIVGSSSNAAAAAAAEGGNFNGGSNNNNIKANNGADAATGELGGDSEQQRAWAQARRQMVQLEKTRGLFARELHDYSPGKQRQKANQLDLNGAQGLNSTRVLVVLASSNDATNRMILEAASESMLEDYVWVTSHEWLASVEMPAAEMANANGGAGSQSSENNKQANNNNDNSNRLPRLLLSTRLETYESHGFRRYLSSLSPAIHAPIPTPWFDEFWQQHFRCRLPIHPVGGRNYRQAGGDDSSLSSPVSAANQLLPTCKAHQHFDMQHMVDDDRVHYAIEALESIHEALAVTLDDNSTSSATDEFAGQLRRSLERRRQLGSSVAHLSSISHLPYGFHIVHRLLPLAPAGPQQQQQQVAESSSLSISSGSKPNGTAPASGRRRANSRDLSASESRAQGQLLRVGLWRDGQLILLLKRQPASLNSNNNNNNEQNMKNTSSSSSSSANDNGQSNNHRWWLNSRAAAMDPTGSLDQDTASSIQRSLAKLGAIKSRCSSGQTCALCRQQIDQTMAILRQEEARLGQSESVAEPTAISSIWSHRQQPQNLDSIVPNQNPQTFDEDDQLTGESSQENTTNEGDADDDSDNDRDQQSNGNDRRDIQASASSLFDGSTSKQVGERQRELEMRRLYGHMTKLQQGRWLNGLQPPISLNLHQVPALVTSMLSLVGVVCVVASMTYFYPNMLERAAAMRAKAAEGPLNYGPEAVGLASYTLSNINDYFLLTGLLMLYSINVAFLLPATMGVCWFRRIGLAISYTVIFSSILVKVMNSCRQLSRQQFQHQQLPQTTSKREDPLEDGVEVTFESLTHDQGLTSVDEDQQQQQQTTNCSTIDQLTNGYQTAALTNHHQQRSQPITTTAEVKQQSDNRCDRKWYTSQDASTMLVVSISLILGQIVVSLVWFIQQPPEPTLYFACWRCASPSRSPVLFLYEPLLSFLYPAVILLLAWCLSLIAFRMASKSEEQYRKLAATAATTTKASLQTNNQYPAQTNYHHHDNQLNYKQRQLDYKLRDAKSLIMATTIIVFVWSIVTLNMISTSTQKSHHNYHHHQQQTNMDSMDLNLVYANLLSGAIIFSFLFIYRLHLFPCPRRSKRHYPLTSSSSLSSAASLGGSHVLKFNNHSNQHHLRDNKWFGSDGDMFPVPMGGNSFFNGSQFSAAGNERQGRHERLKLQQFNSSYGTYSAADAAGPTENYHTSTTINPLHTQTSDKSVGSLNNSGITKGNPKSKQQCQKASSSSSSGGGGALSFFGRSSPFTGSGNRNKKKQPPVPKPRTSNGQSQADFRLQRRQSSGSVASSTAKLVGDNSSMDNEDMFMDDTISCASSVASSSTSQLQGNDLYPIDCSIQLDSQLPNQQNSFGLKTDGGCALNRSGSFNRRSSVRRSMTQHGANKLGSVREEQVATNKLNGVDGQQEQQPEQTNSGQERSL